MRQVMCLLPCDVCGEVGASVLCANDDAALCQGCDMVVHEANSIARGHTRVAIDETTRIEAGAAATVARGQQFNDARKLDRTGAHGDTFGEREVRDDGRLEDHDNGCFQCGKRAAYLVRREDAFKGHGERNPVRCLMCDTVECGHDSLDNATLLVIGERRIESDDGGAFVGEVEDVPLPAARIVSSPLPRPGSSESISCLVGEVDVVVRFEDDEHDGFDSQGRENRGNEIKAKRRREEDRDADATAQPRLRGGGGHGGKQPRQAEA